MQKTLFIKLTVIASLCVLFAIGLTMFSSVITERQYYADSVVREIADQHVNPQEIITPFIAIPVTTTPECTSAANKANKCAPPFTTINTVFAAQTSTTQNLDVSTDTYQRGIYHATSYNCDISFKQSYKPQTAIESIETADVQTDMPDTTAVHDTITMAKQTITNWEQAKLIIPVSDLRGVPTLPTVTIDKQTLKATYPSVSMLNGLSYVEVALPQNTVTQLKANATALPNTANSNINANQAIDITIDLPLVGISNLNTVPTGSNFELSMQSNWHAPNFIGKA